MSTPLTIVSQSVTQPTGMVHTGTFTITADSGSSSGPLTINIPGVTSGNEGMYAPVTGPNQYAYTKSGIAPGTYAGQLLDAGPTHLAPLDFSFTINQPPGGPVGCMLANAFNYDQTATQDTDPTSCVFVIVDLAPAQLVAAHLPIPVQIRAAPTITGLASIVVLLLETADALAGPWVEFAQLKTGCDTQAVARFNLSEAAKSLLRINPPVELGPDPSLSALLRVRYSVLDPVTLTEAYSGDVGTCRVLNAVQQASSGALLTTPTPYATVPIGGGLWASDVTYAGGVASVVLAKDENGCRARQFVWLNAAGAWDSGFFYGRHAHGTDQQDPIAYRDLAGADRYASKGMVRDTLQVYSDKLDWSTYQLVRGVRLAVQVYERVGAGQYVPVLVSSESFSEYQEQTDKTYEVNFTVSYPAQLIQTQ